MIELPRIKIPAPVLPAREGVVDYPVSTDYNGGHFVKGIGLIAGYDVPEPIVPHGFELVEMYFGLQYNNYPPTKKNMLRKKK